MKRVTGLLPILVLILLCIPGCEAKEPTVLNSVEDLEGKTVGTQEGCLYEQGLTERNIEVNLQFFSDPTNEIEAVKQKKIDAFLTEDVTYNAFIKHVDGYKLIEQPVAEYETAIGVGKTKNETLLLSQMNEFIAKSKEDGTLDQLYKYWIEEFNEDTCKMETGTFSGENGTIKIAYEGAFQPYSYIKDNELIGYDIDFICRFCRAYGYKPEFLDMAYDAIPAALTSGKCEFGTNIIVSKERSNSDIALSECYVVQKIYACFYTGVESKNGTSIADSFQKTFMKENRWKLFADGLKTTIIIVVFSILLGTFLGYLIYLFCRNRPVAAKVFGIFQWILQGVPTVLFLMILYYLVFKNVSNGIYVAIIGFTILFTSAMYSMIENGVKSVGVGQLEAARAQGFSDFGAFRYIIMPQAIQHFLPLYKDNVISILKESSIVGYIAIEDLTKMGDMVRARTFEAFFPLIATALIYFAVIVALIALVNLVQKKMIQM